MDDKEFVRDEQRSEDTYAGLQDLEDTFVQVSLEHSLLETSTIGSSGTHS